MLFFKDILEEKLEDGPFKSMFQKECHICGNTVNLVSKLEEDRAVLLKILEKQGISQQAYNNFKQGDNCLPEIVLKLYDGLGLDPEGLLNDCPKLNPGIGGVK